MPTARRTVSPAGLAVLKEREGGFYAEPYEDASGLAIGYGMQRWKGKKVTPDLRITQEEADQEFERQVHNVYAPIVRQALKVPVSQQQFDALVSVAFNLPAAGVALAEKLNAGRTLTAQDFQSHVTSEGKPHRGLQKRRQEEFQSFSSPDAPVGPAAPPRLAPTREVPLSAAPAPVPAPVRSTETPSSASPATPSRGRTRSPIEMTREAQALKEREFNQRLDWVMAEMRRLGYPVRLASTKRTADQQAALYAQGRTTRGNVITEKSGQPGDESLHQLGQAADFHFPGKQKPWALLGQVAKQYGLGWGGDWKTLVDQPHVQAVRTDTQPPEVTGWVGNTNIPTRAPNALEGYTDPASVRVTQGERTLPPLARVQPVSAAPAASTTTTTVPPTTTTVPPTPSLPPLPARRDRVGPAVLPLSAVGRPTPTPLPSPGPPARGDIALTREDRPPQDDETLPPMTILGPRGATPRPPIQVDPASVEALGDTGPDPTPSPGQQLGAMRPKSATPIDLQGASDPASLKVTGPGAAPTAAPRPASWPEIIAGIAKQEGVNPSLAVATAEQENEPFDPAAVSPEGKIGLMQVSPEMAAKYKLDPKDPIQNITAGVRELKALTTKYGANLDRAAAAYHLGESAVDVGEGVPETAHDYLYGTDTRPGVLSRIGKYADIGAPPAKTEPPPKEPPKIGPGPAWGWDLVRQTLPLAGATLGQVGGATVGGIAAAPTTLATMNPYVGLMAIAGGNVGGAYAGGATGETVVMGLETLARKLGVFSEGLQPITAEGFANRFSAAGQTGAEGAAASEFLGATGKWAFGFAKKALQTWYPEVRAQFQPRITILPAQVTTSRVLSTASNLAEASLGGNKPMTAVRVEQQKEGTKQVEAILDELGPKGTTAESAGAIVQQHLPQSAVETAKLEAARVAEEAEAKRLAATGQVQAAKTQAQTTAEEAEARRRVAAGELRSAQGTARAGAEVRTAEEAARAARGETTTTGLQTGLGGEIEAGPAGAAVQAGREEAVKEFRVLEKGAWGAYEDEATAIPVTDTPLLDAFIEKVTGQQKGTFLPNAGVSAARAVAELAETPAEKEAQGLVVIGGKKQPFASLPANLQEALQAGVQEAGPAMNAVELARTVSDIGTVSRALTASAKLDPSKYSKQAGLAKELYRIARLELTNTLGTLQESAARRAYEVATSTTKAGQRRLFNKTMLQLVQLDPDKLVGRLLTKNNATAVRMVTRAVGDAYMEPLRAAAFQALIVRDVETGGINYAKTVLKMRNIGDETLRAMFPKGEPAQFRQFAETLFEAEHLAGQAQQAEARGLAQARRGMSTTLEQNRQAKLEAARGVTQAQQGAAATEAANRAAKREAQKNIQAATPDLFDPLRNEAQTALVLGKLLKKDNVEMIRAVREAIGPHAFEPTQRVMLDRLVARNAQTGAIEWGETLSNLASDKYDKATLDAFFPGGHADRLRELAKNMWRLEQHNPAPPFLKGRVPMVLTELGLVSAGVYWQHPYAATSAVFLGFPLMARLMASPEGSRLLIEGLKTAPGSPGAKIAAGQLVTFMMRDTDYQKAAAENRTPRSPAVDLFNSFGPTPAPPAITPAPAGR